MIRRSVFILLDPHQVAREIDVSIPPEFRELLGEGDYMCWALAVIQAPFEHSTVNLRSPIVVNPATRRAAQLILDQSYPIRHSLIQQKKGDR
jgi:flagellar assembly factor FliW